MQVKNGSHKKNLSWLQTVGMMVLMPGLIWVAHFWHSQTFGLYEDDITLVPMGVQFNLPDLLKYIASYIYHLYGNGHPLSTSTVWLFANLGWRISGMFGAYLIGFLVLSTNAILFFFLIKRVGSAPFAITSSFAYVLFSADTTQPFLVHSLGLNTAITFLLLAMILYLSRKYILSYLCIIGSILSYETAYLIFLAVPMLEPVWDRAWVKRFVRHVLIVIAILILDVFLRSFNGESRVTGLSFPDIITVPISHMLIGPLVALGTYFYRPFQALRGMSLEIGIAVLASFAILGIILSRQHWETTPDFKGLWTGIQQKTIKDWATIIRGWSWPASPNFGASLPPALKPVLRLGMSGLVMLVLAYPLTFTVRPYAISGRDTRVHLTANVGSAIFLTSVIALVFYLVQSNGLRKWLSWGLALLLALLVGFGFVVQKDYSQAWINERTFWTSLLPKIQDMSDGTVILIDPNGLKDTRQIGGNTWNMPRVLNQIYTFPTDWKSPPRVFRLVPGWESHLVNSDGLFKLDDTTTTAPPSLYASVKSTNVILFDTMGGKLTRITAPLTINGQVYPLKPPTSSSKMNFPLGFLYGYFIINSQWVK